MRLCLIASCRYPVAEPFAGGLEAHTHALARLLRTRGHDVTLFAAPGSDPELEAELLPVAPFASSDLARADVAAPPEWWMQEHHAYLDLMLALQREEGRFDVVHNNSLHHLPIAMAHVLDAPLVTTLHTPPLPWIESAVALARPGARFVAVSRAMAEQWSHCVEADVVHNGVDTDGWRDLGGGDRLVWSGRIVPEKAPHEAVLAARRAGLPLDLVGPVTDQRYYDEQVAPLLDDGPRGARYVGHLSQHGLRALVGRAAAAVVTPQWDEPFGLVAAEALSCGTPVVAYARGALPEIVGPGCGVLVAPGDVDGLARGIVRARHLDRGAVRAVAVARFGAQAMVAGYEEVYADVRRRRLEAA